MGGWARMYKRYEAIAIANHDKNLVAAVNSFKVKIGLSSPQSNCQNLQPNSSQFESGINSQTNSSLSRCQGSESQIAGVSVSSDLFSCMRDTCPQGEEELVKREFVSSNAEEVQSQPSTNMETNTIENQFNPNPEPEITPPTNSDSEVNGFFNGLDSQTITPDIQAPKPDPEVVPEDQRYRQDPTIRSIF